MTSSWRRDPMTDRKRWWELRWWIWLLALLVVAGIGSIIWRVASEGTVPPPGADYKVLVVNAIPGGIANDETDNSEPSLAVNPQNPDEMVMSALLLGWGGTCEPDQSAVLRSLDRGKTWGLHCALPLNDTYFAGDISLAYAGDGTSLYGGFQPGQLAVRVHLIKTAPSGSATWPVDYVRPEGDQNLRQAHTPWVAAGADPTTNIVAIGVDAPKVNDCNTGVVYWNLGGGSFNKVCVSHRSSTTKSGDPWTPVVRTAIHGDGTVYAATLRVQDQPEAQGGLLDVIVFRHDKGASLTTPFNSLLDDPPSPSSDPCAERDGNPGYRVVRCVPVPFESLEANQTGGFAQERRMWTSLALAVDPNDSKHVFVAWGDTAGPTLGMTLHVRESTNAGGSWGAADLVTIQQALNPALAVSVEGRLGFSYQRLEGSGTSQRWVTEMQVIGTARPPAITIFKLATMVADQPLRCMQPYVGDYMNLISVGNDFYGAFSTSADITPSNFPEGLATPARNPPIVDPNVCQEESITPEMSIDPYFFSIERINGPTSSPSALSQPRIK